MTDKIDLELPTSEFHHPMLLRETTVAVGKLCILC